MATIDDRAIVERVIHGNGYYPGDEDAAAGPVVRITRYVNAHGGVAFGLVYRVEAEQLGDLDKYQRESQYIRCPVIVWELPRERWHEPAGARR